MRLSIGQKHTTRDFHNKIMRDELKFNWRVALLLFINLLIASGSHGTNGSQPEYYYSLRVDCLDKGPMLHHTHLGNREAIIRMFSVFSGLLHYRDVLEVEYTIRFRLPARFQII
jgi:hypothetical protein